MAPEQFDAINVGDGLPADIYALGAILYELLTGRTPFGADACVAILERGVAPEPSPPSRLPARAQVPRDLDAICLKCLQAEPSRAIPTPAPWPTTCGASWPASPSTPGRLALGMGLEMGAATAGRGCPGRGQRPGPAGRADREHLVQHAAQRPGPSGGSPSCRGGAAGPPARRPARGHAPQRLCLAAHPHRVLSGAEPGARPGVAQGQPVLPRGPPRLHLGLLLPPLQAEAQSTSASITSGWSTPSRSLPTAGSWPSRVGTRTWPARRGR